MDEELKRFCSNCKKNVGAANFASHSAYCQRNITICDVCDEAVSRNLMKEHEEEYHISVECAMCKISIKKWRLEKHQEEMCPKRRVICEFCESDFSIDEAQEHFEFCGSRTEKCSMCSKYIMFKHKKKHLEIHEHEENFLRRKDSGEVHQNKMNEIISKSSKKGIKSDKTPVFSEKNSSIVTDDFDFGSMVGATAPVLEKTKSEKISDENTICHLCRKYILWSEYEQHINNCASENSFRKCPHCDDYVSPNAMKNHNYTTCERRKKLKTQLNNSDSKTECRSSSSYERSESRNQYKSDYSSYDDHGEDKLQLCPFCNQLLLRDTISEHLKSCPDSYYECDLCLGRVSVKDRDTHLNTQCKILQKEDDSYECPLCGDVLPEKDKSSHESFSCRTLLSINKGPLYSLPVEATSTKYPTETYNNLTETCMNCKKKMTLNELFNHKKNCSKTMTKPCAYCDKELHGDEAEEKHLKICEVYNEIVKLNDGERYLDRKGAKPKHSIFSEIVKPEVGKCSFCKTTLNKDILLYHEKECIYKQIRCPDCYSFMLLKDYDKHRCKSSYGRGGKKIQRTEKPESKSSWTLSGLLGFNRPSVKPTVDEHQNDRNKSAETHMQTSYGVKDNDLYFAQQPMMDDIKIPCEFCDKLIPASDAILHMTACNPDEVSFPKSISTERPRENEDSSRHLKHGFDSTASSKDFFLPARGTPIPSTKYESIHKRLEQSEVMPGQYLHYNSAESSKFEMLQSGLQSIGEKNQSSALKSVWNNDSSDVEMEEDDPKPSSKTVAENMQGNVKEKSRKSSHETETLSVDSDEEMSSMINFIEGDAAESANVREENDSYTLDKHDMMSEKHTYEDSSPSKSDPEMNFEKHDNLKMYVSSTVGISSFESIPKEYDPIIKSVHHKIGDQESLIMNEKSQDTSSEETNKAYSSKLNSKFHVSKTDRRHKEGSFINEYRYISNADEKSVVGKGTKEITVNPNLFSNKMKTSDDDNDDFDHLRKTDKYQYRKDICRTDSDSSQSETLQPANITEKEFILDEREKLLLSNFRFCCNKMKNSANESGKFQISENKEYDVYYKTNALGYVTEDLESKIRRPKKMGAVNACQNNVIRSKYEKQDDNVFETSSEESTKSRMQYGTHSLPEKSFKMLRLKYMHQDDDDDDQTSQKEKNKSRLDGASSLMHEKSRELLKSKYMCQDDDDDIQVIQKERTKSKHDDASFMHEKSREMLKSKCVYQDYDHESQASRKGKNKSEQDDVSSSMHQKSKEMLKSKYMHQDNENDIRSNQNAKTKSRSDEVCSSMLEKGKEQSKFYTVCPMCRETIRWIDYNTHIPACATSSGRCARCGIEVPSSDLKEHILAKCSKIRGKVESVNVKNQQILSSRAQSYERVLESLTSNENVGRTKSLFEMRDDREQQFENARMKTASRDKVDSTEPNKNSYASGSKQAFKIEPAKNYWNPSEAKNRKVVNVSEKSRESHLQETGESPNRLSYVEDVEKWRKWRSKTSDV